MKFTEMLEPQRGARTNSFSENNHIDTPKNNNEMRAELSQKFESADESEKLFSIERTPGRMTPMLELRKRDGSSIAIPYASIVKIEYDPKGIIRIFYNEEEFKIVGINLVTLHRHLLRQNVIHIQESDSDLGSVNDGGKLFIEGIEVGREAIHFRLLLNSLYRFQASDSLSLLITQAAPPTLY